MVVEKSIQLGSIFSLDCFSLLQVPCSLPLFPLCDLFLTVVIGFCTTQSDLGKVGVMKHIVFQIQNRILTTHNVDGILVVQSPDFIRKHQFSFLQLCTFGGTAISSFGLRVGINVNGFCSQTFGNILKGTLFIPAQIEKRIAVSHNRFPLFLIECFQLREILQDDRAKNLPLPHGGQ